MQLGYLLCNLVIRAVGFPVNVWGVCWLRAHQAPARKTLWHPRSVLRLLSETNVIFITPWLLTINQATAVCSSPITPFWRWKIPAAQNLKSPAPCCCLLPPQLTSIAQTLTPDSDTRVWRQTLTPDSEVGGCKITTWDVVPCGAEAASITRHAP